MAQGHLDRLSSVDAGFLHMEEEGAHMHIGALGVFEGPPPSIESFRAHIDARLPQLPRYRQRIQEMPLGTGRPLWVEDTSSGGAAFCAVTWVWADTLLVCVSYSAFCALSTATWLAWFCAATCAWATVTLA